VFKSVVPDPKNAHDLADPARWARAHRQAPGSAVARITRCADAHRFVVQPIRRPGALTTDPRMRSSSRPRRMEDAKRTVQPRPSRAEIRRGIRQQTAAEHQRSERSHGKTLSRGLLELALNISPRPKPAMRCASPPMVHLPADPERAERLIKRPDVQIVYPTPRTRRQTNRPMALPGFRSTTGKSRTSAR
jgi:hypothetical protein